MKKNDGPKAESTTVPGQNPGNHGRSAGHGRRNPHSIFLKLIGIFLLAGLLLNVLGFAFFRLGRSFHQENRIETTLLYLLESTIIRHGTPPSRKTAETLLSKYSLALAYSPDRRARMPMQSQTGLTDGSRSRSLSNVKIQEDAESGEASEQEQPAFSLLAPEADFEETEDLQENPGNTLDFHEGRLMARIHREEGTYWIQYDMDPGQASWSFPGFLFSLSAVLFLAYFLMRRTLSPIKQLMTGVQQTSSGNLSYRIPVKRKDELGRLASLYNQMQEKIEEMLESRRQLLLDVSHEVRTPLTRMKLSLEFIPESSRTEAIQQEIQLLDAMLTEVLENERLSSLHGELKLEKRDLSYTVADIVSRFQDAGVQIEAALNQCIVNHDPPRMAMAIQNLLENAIRHTDSSDRKIRISLTAAQDYARITVSDNGHGIPETERNRIFEPFYRRPASSRGFGLGLSLVDRIVRAHGGTIVLISEATPGATFEILLPREGPAPTNNE